MLPVWRILAGLEVGRVDRDHRRHLGAAVAFEQLDAELLAKGVGDRLAQLLGAHQHVAQRGELLAGALARVGPRRTSAWRAATCRRYFCDQLADGFGVHRIRMIDHAAAADQRKPDGDREAEGVKERQHADDPVVASRSRTPAPWPRCSKARCSARASRPWACPCCRSRRSRSPAIRTSASTPAGAPAASRGAPGSARSFGERRWRCSSMSSTKTTPSIASTCAFARKMLRRHHRADAALRDRRVHGFAAGGEVQIHRDLPAIETRRGWPARRRPTAAAARRSSLARRCRAASAQQHARRSAPRRRSVRGRWNRPWRSGASSCARARMKRTGSVSSPRHAVARPRRWPVPGSPAAPRARVASAGMRRAERDRHRIRNALGPLPEKLAALETEDAAPQAIQMHRNHRARRRPSTIFSRPRLNGSRLPVRLMAPSAKMQTTWPSSSSLRAAPDATPPRRAGRWCPPGSLWSAGKTSSASFSS